MADFTHEAYGDPYWYDGNGTREYFVETITGRTVTFSVSFQVYATKAQTVKLEPYSSSTESGTRLYVKRYDTEEMLASKKLTSAVSKSVSARTWTTIGTMSFSYTIPASFNSVNDSVPLCFEYDYSFDAETVPFQGTGGADEYFWPLYVSPVHFNANGGSGTPLTSLCFKSAHMICLAIPQNAYTRQGYRFVNWGDKADASEVTYTLEPGTVVTDLSQARDYATMYAQWLIAPSVANLALQRVDSNGNPDDMGGRIRCVAAWDTDPTLTGSTMVFSCGSASTTVSVSGSSGEATGIIDVSADPSQQYTVTAILTDSAGYTRAITATSTTEYTMPAITSFSVERVDDDGDLSDDGERIAYEVRWRVANIGSQTGPALLVLRVSDSESVPVASVSITEFTPSASGNVATGTTSGIITVEGGFSTDSHYGVSATLRDDTERQANVYDTLPEAYFPFDILMGGHGAAFGKPAKTAELLDIGYGLNVDGDATVGAGPTLQVELSGICTIELRPDNTAYRNSSYIGTWLSEQVIVLGGSGYRKVTVSESGDIVARFGVDTLATGTYAARGSVEVDGEPYSNVTVIITATGYAIDANGNGRFSESVYAKGYKVNGEQAYPTFIRAGWSESSDESTLPATPCFVLNPTNSAYYFCDGE